MNFGLSEEEWKFLQENLISPLKSQEIQLWLFGSRSIGSFNKFSDIDIMVDAKKDLSKEISKINEFLEESNFPYKVDIVQLSQFAKEYLPEFEKQNIKL